MILKIFKKLFNNEKGGVEFIESSIVFPIIQIFILLLLILSFNTFYKIYTFEKAYKEGRSEFYYKKEDKNLIAKSAADLFKEKNTNFNLSINKRTFDIQKKSTLFNNNVDIYEKEKLYLSTNKMETDDIIRKLDFMKKVYLDLKDLESFKKLGGFTDSINNMKDNLMKKVFK